MSASVSQPIGKIRVTRPTKPEVRDLTNPDVIRMIWEEADKATRADRSRRIRRIRLRNKTS